MYAARRLQFQCRECKRKNYSNMKNKKTTTERMELKKFCPFCRKHHRAQGDQVAARVQFIRC